MPVDYSVGVEGAVVTGKEICASLLDEGIGAHMGWDLRVGARALGVGVLGVRLDGS